VAQSLEIGERTGINSLPPSSSATIKGSQAATTSSLDPGPTIGISCRLGGAFVALPPLNDAGDLPAGVHGATLPEILDRFGQGSVQRRAVSDRLNRIYQLVASTGQLARFVVFGSFVTDKTEPSGIVEILGGGS
jgi:hypothetical protein